MDLISSKALIKRLQQWNTNDATDKALYNFAMNRINEQPTVEAVPKSYAYQISWERDIAIEQLNEIGCQFGQKMDEVKKKLEASQWIPCSERLPVDLEDVFVWIVGVFKDGVHVGEECQWYGVGYQICAKWNVLSYKDIKDIKVIAWMPLPEPYKGE